MPKASAKGANKKKCLDTPPCFQNGHMIWIQWKLNGWILSWIFSNSFSILKGKQKHSIPMLRLVANYGQISSKRNPSGFFLPKPLAKKRCITLPPKATFNPTSPHPPIRLRRGQRTPNVDEEMLKVPRDQGLRCHWKRNEGSLGWYLHKRKHKNTPFHHTK